MSLVVVAGGGGGEAEEQSERAITDYHCHEPGTPSTRTHNMCIHANFIVFIDYTSYQNDVDEDIRQSLLVL